MSDRSSGSLTYFPLSHSEAQESHKFTVLLLCFPSAGVTYTTVTPSALPAEGARQVRRFLESNSSSRRGGTRACPFNCRTGEAEAGVLGSADWAS